MAVQPCLLLPSDSKSQIAAPSPSAPPPAHPTCSISARSSKPWAANTEGSRKCSRFCSSARSFCSGVPAGGATGGRRATRGGGGGVSDLWPPRLHACMPACPAAAAQLPCIPGTPRNPPTHPPVIMMRRREALDTRRRRVVREALRFFSAWAWTYGVCVGWAAQGGSGAVDEAAGRFAAQSQAAAA